jgi:ABC-type Mn2+/Zn2+ transport system permease subunit
MTLLSVSSALLAGVMAIAAGLMGAYALMRRMTLAADALSHVALPGIAVALILGASPLAGAIVALLLGAVLIWTLGRRAHLATEAIIGVVFSAALAVGALLATGDELAEALFGTTTALSVGEIGVGFAGAVCIIAFAVFVRDRLVVMFVSPDIARTAGINVARLDLIYLLAFAVTVGLGLRYLGVLLMGSLLIVPAATARLVAGSLKQMLMLSAGIALGVTVAGIQLAARLHRPSGPLVVIVATVCFAIAAVLGPKRRAGISPTGSGNAPTAG